MFDFEDKKFIVPNPNLAQNKAIEIILGVKPRWSLWTWANSKSIYLGWGHRPSGLWALKKARQTGRPSCLLEDGFLRSFTREETALSIVFDDQGIYYDASQPSRLENLIQQSLTEQQEERTQNLIQLWRAKRVSKYNAQPDYTGGLPQDYVLVIDQVRNDQSIAKGLANAQSFQTMLEAALAEHPHSQILLKVHPDTITRPNKNGHFDIAQIQKNPRITIIFDPCHPVRLLEQAKAVYTVTSQMGFEALLWGKPVRTFGMPFYAGWGLTKDEQRAPERRNSANLLQITHAALIDYPVYLDPENHTQCQAEAIIEYLGERRSQI